MPYIFSKVKDRIDVQKILKSVNGALVNEIRLKKMYAKSDSEVAHIRRLERMQ